MSKAKSSIRGNTVCSICYVACGTCLTSALFWRLRLTPTAAPSLVLTMILSCQPSVACTLVGPYRLAVAGRDTCQERGRGELQHSPMPAQTSFRIKVRNRDRVIGRRGRGRRGRGRSVTKE